MAIDLERKLAEAVVDSEMPLCQEEMCQEDEECSEDVDSELETDGRCCDRCEKCAHQGELTYLHSEL